MLNAVVDEGPYIQALKAGCTLDAVDLRWARVVQLVQDQHRWVVTPEILSRYQGQFARVDCKSPSTSAPMRSLTAVLTDLRSLFIENPPEVEGGYHRKDRHVVAAAAAAPECILITTDRRLADALDAEGIPAAREFAVCLIDEAELRLGLAD